MNVNHVRCSLVFFVLLVTFAFFTQGGGWNQNARVGEIRAIAENGHFSLGEYAKITGDVSHYHGKVFSNKTPSMTFVVAPLYWLVFQTANFLGINTSGRIYQIWAVYLITLLSSSIWGALVGLVLYWILGHFPGRYSTNQKLWLSLFLPLATILFPYSTMAFAHPFETFWFLLAFYSWILYSERASFRNLLMIGIAYPAAALANPSLVLMAPFFYIYIIFVSKNYADAVKLGCVMFIMFIPFFLYNQINFGHFLVTNRVYQDPKFTDPHLFLGVFNWPQWDRLYGLLFTEGNRSIAQSQPFLLLAIPGTLLIMKQKLFSRPLAGFILASATAYLTFMLTFNEWQGGSAFGPRYMVPFLILMGLLTAPLIHHFPVSYRVSSVLSAFAMLMVTAINPQTGSVEESLWNYFAPHFFAGKIALSQFPIFVMPGEKGHAFNLGHILGLEGLATLLPLLGFYLFLLPIIFYKNGSLCNYFSQNDKLLNVTQNREIPLTNSEKLCKR